LVFGLTALSVYLAGFKYVGGADTAPNELLPIAVLQQGRLDFNEFFGADAALPRNYVRVNGRVVSFVPIVPGLLNVPVHVVASWLGMTAEPTVLAKWTCALVTAASVAMMYLALLNVCATWRGAAVMTGLYGFATCAWSVAANALWQHGPSLLFLSGALVFLLNPSSRWLPLAGFFLGLAVFNRPTNVVFALPLVVYVMAHQRARLPLFAVALAVPLIAMATYSQVYWGSILALGQGQGWKGTHGTLRTGFDGPLLPDLAGLLVSPGRGLFIFSPIFLFSVAGLAWVRTRAVYPYLAIGALAHLIVLAKWNIWWGGWSFGYRLLMEMIPALMVFLALAWEHIVVPKRAWRPAFLAAAALSVYIHGLGAYFYPSGWNGSPENVDVNPARVWQVRDTELSRCQSMLIKSVAKRAPAFLKPARVAARL